MYIHVSECLENSKFEATSGIDGDELTSPEKTTTGYVMRQLLFTLTSRMHQQQSRLHQSYATA